MKKKYIYIIPLLILSNHLYCQQKYNQSFYLELLGNGGLYSFNYEHNLYESLNARAGLSYTFSFLEMITMPIMLNYSNLQKDISPELGVGFTLGKFGGFLNNTKSKYGIVLTGTIGIRFQSKEGNLFKIAYTPLINPTNGKILHFGGIGFGERF